MIIRELAARLGLDIDQTAFEAADAALGAVKGGLVALGALAGAAAAGLAGAVAATAAYADQVDKAAKRTGIGVEALQALQYAAERADVGTGELQAALNHMARRGVKDFQAEFGRAADELMRLPEGGARAKRAIELFGRSGAMLLPMLHGGSAALEEMTTKARDMGIILGEDGVAAGAAVKDALEDLQGYVRGLAYLLGSPLLGSARKLLETLSRWVSANRKVIASRVDQVLRVLGTAAKWTWQLLEPLVRVLVAVASNAWVVKAAIAALAAVMLGALGSAVLGLIPAIGKLIASFKALLAWQTLSAALPILIGAALLALALIAEDVFRFIRGEGSVIGELERWITDFVGATEKINPDDNPLVILLKHLRDLIQDVRAAWQALAEGRFGDAFMTGVKMALRPAKAMVDVAASQVLDDRGRAAYFGAPPTAPPTSYYPAESRFNVGQINVTVPPPPGADPERFGIDVAAAVHRELGIQVEAAGGALLLRPEGP